MLPSRNLVLLLTAGAAAAATVPVERQSTPVLRVLLSNSASGVSEEYDAGTDSTAISVSSTATYDTVKVDCLEICIPEYHCTLYDKSLNAIMDVNPGTTTLSNLEVGQVTCASGLAARRRLRQRRQWSYRNDLRTLHKAASLEPRQTFTGEAIFTDADTGEETRVGFYVDEEADLGVSIKTMSKATVETTSGDTSEAYTCVAYDKDGVSMGTFFGTARYSYTFVPGVVSFFLCGTET